MENTMIFYLPMVSGALMVVYVLHLVAKLKACCQQKDHSLGPTGRNPVC